MTREEAKEFLPIIQAFAEGKTILVQENEGYWRDADVLHFNYDTCRYRIKPEPKYRPFNSAEECWQEMQKHQPFGWIAKGKKLYAIKAVECNTVFIDDDCENRSLLAFSNDGFTFADGEPFGVKEV